MSVYVPSAAHARSLTNDQVRRARQMREDGNTVGDIAQRFNISRAYASEITGQHCRRYVPPQPLTKERHVLSK